MNPTRTLLVSCPDERNLIATITSSLSGQGANIVGNDEFVDPPSGRFFMRTLFEGDLEEESLLGHLRQVLPEDSEIRLAPQEKRRLMVLATREAHCLGDLLVRCAQGDLHAEIVAVVSNHDHLRGLVEGFGLPYHHISAEGLDRSEHEVLVQACLRDHEFDWMVLAKYMRILTPKFVSLYPNRIVNIHHSFLPAFVGANPYRQAYERGVKVIGATAHFVNHELDEGPIISQGVQPVDHRLDPKELARVGRDIEKTTLAKAIDLVCQERVFLAGHRSVVF